MQKYYQNEPKFNGAYSGNNLSESKDGAYVMNLLINKAYVINEYESIETHWIALFVNGNNIIHFDSYGVYHIPIKKTKKFIVNKNIIINTYRLQAYSLIICGYFCIGYIDFMLKSKSF